MKIETALALLEQTDAELIKVDADATAELRQVQSIVGSHEAALKLFRTTGQGILDAVNARGWLEDFDRLLFPNQHAINAVSASSQRETFFAFQNRRLAADAREGYIRQHAEPLATAIQAVVTARSRNRDKWRQQVVAQAQALKSREMLGEALTVDESRRIESLDRSLGEADFTFGGTNNALLKFRAAPTMEHFNEARMHASRIDYESTP
jgi:hypothetical protein